MEILIIIAGFVLFIFSLLGVGGGGLKGPDGYTPPFENEKEEK